MELTKEQKKVKEDEFWDKVKAIVVAELKEKKLI